MPGRVVLPPPEPVHRVAVRLTPDALRRVRGGHPWVFDGSVVEARPTAGRELGEARAGDLAVVFDDRRRFTAIGLWDPASPIRIRVLHRGRPTRIDREWFVDQLVAAADLRRPLLAEGTDGYRVVNGENDGLPGLVVDRYASTAVVKLYTSAWYPHLDDVLHAVDHALAPELVVLRLSRLLQRAEPLRDADGAAVADASTLRGDPPESPVRFHEAGLAFEADVVAGQKTGFFLDQRDNRARVRARSAGADVLDVFSAAGGFSVHAAAGGASSVHSVDISPGAIDAARRNLALNLDDAHVRSCRHRTTTGDAATVMASLAASGERFDVVVIDPPSFASRQDQVPGALRAYRRLTGLALDLLRPGGWLVQASCSARVRSADFVDAVLDAARSHGTALEDVEVTGHALDHPVTFREGEYLAAVFARVAR